MKTYLTQENKVRCLSFANKQKLIWINWIPQFRDLSHLPSPGEYLQEDTRSKNSHALKRFKDCSRKTLEEALTINPANTNFQTPENVLNAWKLHKANPSVRSVLFSSFLVIFVCIRWIVKAIFFKGTCKRSDFPVD